MDPSLVSGNVQDGQGGVRGFFRNPIPGSMGSATDWVLAVGFLVVLVFLWNTVLILMVKEI